MTYDIVALVCGVFFPFTSFLFLLLFSSLLSRKSTEWISCGSIFFSLCSFIWLQTLPYESHYTLWSWIPILKADFSLYVDHISMLMAFIITGVGFLIHVYSIGYIDHDEDYIRYFSIMNLFIFSMLLLVFASNILLLFVGWEGVGLCSYLLIGFWYERPKAAHAAKKAFIVNRIGDLGFLLAIFLSYALFGTTDIQTISSESSHVVGPLSILTLLFFIAAMGKSAQIPLHVWLPNAMEGPTPVSALIHAATMVTAGVYLIVRLNPLYILTPITLEWIGYIGIATSLFAAICAINQQDIKRVLAYSTLSQLGLMFVACSIGAFYAAMFHLTMHAFVKALLFLTAGNVIHMMGGITDMNKMGGLRKKLPKTACLFAIGALSMSALPPLALFFSKDLILEEAFIRGHMTLYYIGLFISFCTAFYMARAYFLTFHGENRSVETVQEAPKNMLLPITILAILSIGGGFLGHVLQTFLKPIAFSASLLQFHITQETYLSVGAALLGVILGALSYTRFIQRLPSTIRFFENGFYINELYSKYIVLPLKIVRSMLIQKIEPFIFKETIEMTSQKAYRTSQIFQYIQSGQIRSYASWIVLGACMFITYVCFYTGTS